MDMMALSLKVVLIPWLGHSHVLRFLDLANKLSNTNIFSVYFCSTPIILNSIQQKVQLSMHKVQLVELHLPSLPDLPPHHHMLKDLPLHLHPTLTLALEMAAPNFASIFDTIKPNLIVYDMNQPWVPSQALSRKIPFLHFQVTGATNISFFYHQAKRRDKEYPFPTIYLTEHEWKRMNKSSTGDDQLSKNSGYNQFDRTFKGFEVSCDMLLVNTWRGLEGPQIDFYSDLVLKKIVPVGALLHLQEEEEEEDVMSEQEVKMFDWMSKQQESSTIFISFGSEYYMTKEEIKEIGHGLELSRVNFIWVIRFPSGDTTEVEEVLPQGFAERVKDRSMVVQGWAPQPKILKHPSIGGFVSHCGWGSVMESISCGVPIIAMPIQYDQPVNARLLVERGVALEVMRDKESGEFKREEVAGVIKQVIDDKTGNDMRKKIGELRESMSSQVKNDTNNMVKELVDLCHNYTTST